MSMHEIFDIEKHPEKEVKKSKKIKIVNKLLNNKRIIFGIAIYVFSSIIYTTISILLTLIKLF
jgi:hypothetical protein